MQIRIKDTTLTVSSGDITIEKTDAIVNAANSSLMGGGGVDGAIHRAGGNVIIEECKAIVAKQGLLPAGEAVVTTAGKMPAKFVIHTVGPVWHGGKSGEENLLKNAYYNSLKSGGIYKIKSIAFPCISTGVYGYPKELAAKTAFNTVMNFILNEEYNYTEIKFVVFGDIDYELYKNIFMQYKK